MKRLLWRRCFFQKVALGEGGGGDGGGGWVAPVSKPNQNYWSGTKVLLFLAELR